ncbi:MULTISPECIES: LysR family transcriptional regulator [Rummeliibacillus]|jgi:DNA-binding transcriptional LysR family regulator|uniref:LysR family transcriptional regulator n=1 Tax=Rummeliibacillus TaxID=648802 RepID=UPI0011B35C80|nr:MULTISPECIES: LysR family transcriptional regulator [Rummeliibacillus]MBO2536247.1 LysR family transcriptional regulator [Rummeliibacillus suwonensis]
MEIRELKYFVAVAKSKSFSKAADALHITQPTLSKVVKSLEKQLDITLFHRSARKSELTDAGEVVYEQAIKILNLVDELDIVLEDVTHLKKGKIKIGMPPLIGILFFPKMIKGFQEKYPGITIEIDERGANVIKDLVGAGELDVGFVMLPADMEEFHVIPYTSQQLMLIVNHSNPLANQETVMMKDLKNEPMLLFSQDFTLHDRILQECEQAGFIPHIAYESSQWDFISQMVEHNLGIAMFPKAIAEKVNPNAVKAIPIVKPAIPWEIVMIIKKDRYLSHATKRFIQYIAPNYSI